jgi:hypothetical protein
MNMRKKIYLAYLRTESSLFWAAEEALRVDVVKVRDTVVRETGDADALLDDTGCSVVDEIGRLYKTKNKRLILFLFFRKNIFTARLLSMYPFYL